MTAREVGRHSNIVVGVLMGALLVFCAYAWAGPYWGTGLAVVALYEGWTLINKYPEDTLSESVWRLATRPLVPWLFGCLSAWMLESGFLQNPYLIAAWFMLQGHFFFQAQREAKKLATSDVVAAIERSPAVGPDATEEVRRAADAEQLAIK